LGKDQRTDSKKGLIFPVKPPGLEIQAKPSMFFKWIPAALTLLLSGCATAPAILVLHPPQRSLTAENPPPASGEGNRGRIRVAIALRQSSVLLEDPETFLLVDSRLPGLTGVSPEPHKAMETVITPESIQNRKIAAVPSEKGEIRVNRKPYRGVIEVMGDGTGTLTVINDVDLEEYVMGVVAGEISPNSPAEALKAQAIAARTYAVYRQQIASRTGAAYDLENTSLFQNYQGSHHVNGNVKKAVLETEAEILTYKNKPILALFHSNCGGRTSRAAGVWNEDFPYLQSVSCDFSNKGPHWKWKAEVSSARLGAALQKEGIGPEDIQELKPLDRDESDRILRLSVRTRSGKTDALKGSKFRMLLGADLIRSTRFEVKREGEKFFFSGRGWGHGVGLCQEGAGGMALKGYRAFEILRHFYRGVLLEKVKFK
jgi:stage II sporulation protein D